LEINTTFTNWYLAIVYVFLHCSVILFLYLPPKEKKGNRPDVEGTLDVVLVGCGLPKKGMGWYHLTQLLEMENVNVKAVVEPFFLNKDLNPNPPSSFTDFVSKTSAQGVMFKASIHELPRFTKKTMCLIAGRTSDNPKLFRECINKGAKCIYLEKPGAPTVLDLLDMRQLSDIMGTEVYIGYNKNVTPYVRKALDLAKTVDGARVTFVHNNSYKESELPECFERNSEGMLKNMAIHELALLNTFFGVSVSQLKDIKVLKDTKQLELKKPSSPSDKPEYIKDFKTLSFLVTTKSGTMVSVNADRCGGNVSAAIVKDKKGKEIKTFEFPDAEEQAKVEEMSKADPDMMPYFFVQSDDYLELKTRVVNSCLKGNKAEGIATLSTAIEAMKLAEYGKEKMSK